MIQIDDKKQCCGCTACESVCPQKCIAMIEDSEGFIYPSVNGDLCVNCGLCDKVCPMHIEYDDSAIPETVVARDARTNVLANGTSGSIFTSIMEYILNNKGVIYGVIVDENGVVKHIRVGSIDDEKMSKIPNSKYCRSDIRGIYRQIKQDLVDGKLVCFSGSPCQASGLKSFLMKDYDNLIVIDVICRGTPSPLFWKKFFEYIENKYKSRIKNVRFRNKTYGYHSGTMKIEFEDGKTHYSSARANYYLRAFFADLVSRPSCYDCHFKHIQHSADLTLYDSWHAAELTGLTDDDKGYTNIIVQTQKGRDLLKNLSTVETYPTDTLRAVELDGIMVKNSVPWNKKRERFFIGINEKKFEEHCEQYIHISLKDAVIEKSKALIYRVGLLNGLKRWLR